MLERSFTSSSSSRFQGTARRFCTAELTPRVVGVDGSELRDARARAHSVSCASLRYTPNQSISHSLSNSCIVPATACRRGRLPHHCSSIHTKLKLGGPKRGRGGATSRLPVRPLWLLRETKEQQTQDQGAASEGSTFSVDQSSAAAHSTPVWCGSSISISG